MLKRIPRRGACAGILALTSLAGCATMAPSHAPEGTVPPHQARHVLQGGAVPDAAPGMLATPSAAVDADQRFTTGAGQTNLAEVAIGQLAMQRSQNEGVRALAQRTMRDHTAVQSQLTTIAQAAGLMMPSEPSPEQRALAERLGRLSGEAFDRAYAMAQVQGHERSEATYEREIARGQSEALRNLARETLPTIRSHLQQSRELATQLGVGTGARDGTTEPDATGDVAVTPSE